MKIITSMLSAVLAVSTIGACHKAAPAADKQAEVADKLPLITVPVLDGMIAKGSAKVFDANNVGTRQKMGVIPGATLLTDYNSYPLTVLPADKAAQLVFYCANEQCMASHMAADRATGAGYTNVAVLSAGIAGWVSAGKQVTHI